MAVKIGFPMDKLLFGGNYLGPNPKKCESSAKVLEKSKELVRAYVEVGFTKIHLDASIPCVDDDVQSVVPMDDEIVVIGQPSFIK